MEEADVHVRREDVDVTKGGVFDAGRRVSIVQEFGDVGAAVAHAGEPFARDRGQFRRARIEPAIDPWFVRDGAVEREEAAHG